MPSIKANDINLYYEIYGKGEPLVLVSGFTQNHLSWRNFIAPLSEHFQVIVFDNRGCGQTDTPDGGYTIKMFAEDIIGLLNGLDIQSAHFMGESMGTLIIQQLCLEHRDRVKKAVLCAPFSYCPPITLFSLSSQLKLLSRGLDRMGLVELNSAWLLSNGFVSNPENIKQFLTEVQSDPYPQSLQGLQNQAYALTEDFRHRIKDIPHQILLLVGERDITTPPYCAEYMCKEMPNSQMHTFKEAAHMFNYEIPEQSVKQALNFLLQK